MPLGRDPDPFLDSFTGLISARALTTATALGVFDALHETPLDSDALAAQIGLDPLGAETLLETLRVLRYVKRSDDGTFQNTEVAERLLVGSSPESIATFIGAVGDLNQEVLAQLQGAVRDGEVYAMHDRHEDAASWEAYIRGLFEISRREHELDANLVPVESPRRLIDVAGGHGGFSMAVCRRFPELEATIVDLPPSAAVGRKIVAEQGLAERIDFRSGDVFEIGLGDGADVVAAFNLVHHLPVERNRELCQIARDALRPGGCMMIGGAAAPEEGELVSDHGAISSLLFYAWSHGGNFKPSAIRGWMEDAGFEEVSLHRNLLSRWRVVVIGR